MAGLWAVLVAWLLCQALLAGLDMLFPVTVTGRIRRVVAIRTIGDPASAQAQVERPKNNFLGAAGEAAWYTAARLSTWGDGTVSGYFLVVDDGGGTLRAWHIAALLRDVCAVGAWCGCPGSAAAGPFDITVVEEAHLPPGGHPAHQPSGPAAPATVLAAAHPRRRRRRRHPH